MAVLKRFTGGVRGLLRRGRAEQELDAELRDFLESAIEHRMRAGMSRAAATRAARLELGSPEAVKDRVRDVGWESIVVSLGNDARYAVRRLRRSPGFTAAAVLTLGLGIGANTAVFSVIQALLLRPLPVPQSGELVQIFIVRRNQRPANAFSYPVVRALAAQREIFEGAFGFHAATVPVGPDRDAEQVETAWVTGEYYRTLRLVPIAGRLLGPDDDRAGAAPVAVITEGYWRRRFNRDPDIIGRTILVYGAPTTIVGVSAPKFTGTTVGRMADLMLPLGAAPQIQRELAGMLTAGTITFSVMARPLPNLTPAEIKARLDTAWPGIVETAMPNAGRSRDRLMTARLDVRPASTGWSALRQQFGTPLFVLMALVGFVLLSVCANTANLLMARTTARRREIATRLALGASRARVTRQLLTESAVLSLCGASLGLAFAWFGSFNLVRFLSSGVAAGLGPSPGPTSDASVVALDVAPDGGVLLFTMLLAIATVLLFGTVPALRATRSGAQIHHAAGATATPRTRAFSLLVITQLALTLLVLICSGLFVRTLQNLRGYDRGFDPHGILLVEIDGRAAGYAEQNVADLYRDLHQAIERMPGVRAVSYSGRTPLAMGETSYGFLINGQPASEESLYFPIGPRYFETIRTPLVAGREFAATDTASAPRVAIVNETFVRSHLRGLEPVGQRLSIAGGTGPPMEIVGVVRDTLFSGNVREVAAPASVYVPYPQSRPSTATFEVAVSQSLAETAAALQRELLARLPNVRFEMRTMGQQLDRALLQERLVAGVSGTFGVLALILAVVGLYGLVAYSVTQRTREIGVRAALGASGPDILHLVIGDALRSLAAGVAVGVPLAWMVSSLFSRMFFGLSATDPWTAAAAVAVLVIAGVAAAYIPARRATRVDPLIALRYE